MIVSFGTLLSHAIDLLIGKLHRRPVRIAAPFLRRADAVRILPHLRMSLFEPRGGSLLTVVLISNKYFSSCRQDSASAE